MNNEDLLRVKININCKNNLAYQDVAYLVDKPEFLRLLPNLRKEYSIKKLIALKEFDNWWKAKIKDDLFDLSKNQKIVRLAREFNKQYQKNPNKIKSLFRMLPFHQRFDWETQLLARRFRRPGYFDLIIKHAIVCGEVDDESWQPTYATIMPPELPFTDSSLPEVVISVSPISRLTDVEKVFKKEVKKLFKQEKTALKYLSAIKKDTAPEIERNRRWYWLSLSGREAGDIYSAEYCDENKPPQKDINIDAISRAISRYKEILTNF